MHDVDLNNEEVIVYDFYADAFYLESGAEEPYDIDCIVDTILVNLTDRNFRGASNKCNKSNDIIILAIISLTLILLPTHLLVVIS